MKVYYQCSRFVLHVSIVFVSVDLTVNNASLVCLVKCHIKCFIPRNSFEGVCKIVEFTHCNVLLCEWRRCHFFIHSHHLCMIIKILEIVRLGLYICHAQTNVPIVSVCKQSIATLSVFKGVLDVVTSFYILIRTCVHNCHTIHIVECQRLSVVSSHTARHLPGRTVRTHNVTVRFAANNWFPR